MDKQPYIKPINKTTLTVRFCAGEHQWNMELATPPKVNDEFLNPNGDSVRIARVCYVPWNEHMEDIRVIAS